MVEGMKEPETPPLPLSWVSPKHQANNHIIYAEDLVQTHVGPWLLTYILIDPYILKEWCLAQSSQKRLPLLADGSRCRDSHLPNVGQRESPKWRSSLGPSPWSSWNFVEKGEMENCGIQMGRGYHENTVHRLQLGRTHRDPDQEF